MAVTFTIYIIDTVTGDTVTEVKNARKDSLQINWNGTDTLDGKFIIGSSFTFTIGDTTHTDGYFKHLFTADEFRYKVELWQDDDMQAPELLLWVGYLLPDEYTEPYANGTIFVQCTATDGLGRLQGKYLPTAYQTGEHSYITILSEVLKLLNIGNTLYFKNAIYPASGQTYDTIYLNTELFTGDDAYTVLNKLCNNVNRIYQRNGIWFFEGLNYAQQRVVNFEVYNLQAIAAPTTLQYTRIMKEVYTELGHDIVYLPPYGRIETNRKKSETYFNESLLGTNFLDGVNLQPGDVSAFLYNLNWVGHGGFYMFYENDTTGMFNVGNAYNETEYVNLRQPVYLKKNRRYIITLDFELQTYEDPESVTGLSNEDVFDKGRWKDPFNYKIFLGGYLYRTNIFGATDNRKSLYFSKQGNASMSFTLNLNNDSFLDINLYRPHKKYDGSNYLPNNITGIYVSNFEVRDLDEASEDDVITLTHDSESEFTMVNNFQLDLYSDKTGTSLQLAPLQAANTTYQEFTVPIRYITTYKGYYYLSLPIYALYMLQTTGAEMVGVNVVDVLYNWLGGNENVIKTDTAITMPANVVIRVYDLVAVTNRVTWDEWTDGVYQIEKQTYQQSVLNVYKRLFNKALIQMRCTGIDNIMFGDFIWFNYDGVFNYIINNCEWNLSGKSIVILQQANYYAEPVISGPDFVYYSEVGDDETIAFQVFTLNGWIANYTWELVSGNMDISPRTPVGNLYEIDVDNIQEDSVLRLTVTDNEGLTAQKEVRVVLIDFQLVYTFLEGNQSPGPGGVGSVLWAEWELKLPDDFPQDSAVLLDITIDFENKSGPVADVVNQSTIYKNGVGWYVNNFNQKTEGDGDVQTFAENITLNLFAGDVIKLRIEQSTEFLTGFFEYLKLIYGINRVEFIDRNGQISNIPVTITTTLD